MQVIIRPTREEATRIVARLVEKAVRANPDLVLGLATGVTMERLYAMLVKLHRESKLDFSLVRTFNLDEYVGLAADDERSYHAYMTKHLFAGINIDRRNTHLLDGMARDLDAECERYEALIKHCGGIGLQLLGVGRDGHIGFNEPLSALYSRTRDKSLTPTTIKQNEKYFGGADRMPRRALTMGVGTILDCRKLIMLVTGDSKAGVLAKAVEGPITSMMTATAIQLHPHCIVVADEEAAAKLEARDYYRWIFENELEWEEFR
jgi:glucosamine-6-phosphate deaminase